MYGSLASIAAASVRIELMKSSWFSRAASFSLSTDFSIESDMALNVSESCASS